jgi:hypothetical protein
MGEVGFEAKGWLGIILANALWTPAEKGVSDADFERNADAVATKLTAVEGLELLPDDLFKLLPKELSLLPAAAVAAESGGGEAHVEQVAGEEETTREHTQVPMNPTPASELQHEVSHRIKLKLREQGSRKVTEKVNVSSTSSFEVVFAAIGKEFKGKEVTAVDYVDCDADTMQMKDAERWQEVVELALEASTKTPAYTLDVHASHAAGAHLDMADPASPVKETKLDEWVVQV